MSGMQFPVVWLTGYVLGIVFTLGVAVCEVRRWNLAPLRWTGLCCTLVASAILGMNVMTYLNAGSGAGRLVAGMGVLLCVGMVSAWVVRCLSKPGRVGAWSLVLFHGLATFCSAQRFYAEAAPGLVPPPPAGVVLPPNVPLRDAAVTDQGRELPIYDSGPADPDQAPDETWLVPWTHRVIQVGAASHDSNCHGWVFTDGRFLIAGAEVELILADNAYEATSAPAADDLAIYRDWAGNVVHTGLVRCAAGDLVMVESKWGRGPRFLHRVEDQPYSPLPPTYYRSPRTGHLLDLPPASPRGRDCGAADPPAVRQPGERRAA